MKQNKLQSKKYNAQCTNYKTRYYLYIVICTLLFVGCTDMFQPKIPHSGKNGSLDSLFTVNNEIDKLSSPQQFYIAPYYSSTEIRLTWNEVKGAAYYMVERAVSPLVTELLVWEEPDDSEYEIMDRYVYGTMYIDSILRAALLDAPEYSNKYFYRVSAFNPSKKYDESEPCEPQSAMLFRTPEGLTASGGTSVDYVELRWDHALGASSYEIWRSEFPNGASASSLGTVFGNQTWFQNRVSTAEQGKDYYYMITALNNFGHKTPQTRPAYGYAKVFGAPDAPASVRIRENAGRGNTTNRIEIVWDEVEELGVYYAVYRYSSVDSSLTMLTANTANTQWLDNLGLRPGVYYYYKVQAIVDDDIKSGKALKSQFTEDDPEGFVLSAPDTVIAEKSQDGNTITVKWKPAIGNDFERTQYRYNVYADTRLDGSFSNNVRNEVLPIIDADGYIGITGLSVENTFFKVSALNNTAESAMSIVVSPSPAAAVMESATQREPVPGENANSSGVYPVKITWKKPANEDPPFYHVQRSGRSESGFARITETALKADGPFNDVYSYDSETGIYTYIDRNDTARTGRKYYYRILSLNQLEQGSFPSDERVGWGALTYNQFMIEYNKTMTAALKKLTYMHRPGSLEKLGTETKNGTLGGTIYYNARVTGLSARIDIKLTDYAEYYIDNEPDNGVYFTLSGDSNTSANMSSNGTMDGTVTCNGMYPGTVKYDRIEIKNGAAGGGYYEVTPAGFSGGNVPWNLNGL